MGGSDTSRTISWVVTDGNTSNGSSIAATSTLTVVHAVPVVTAGGTSTFTGGGSAVTLDGALTVSDADSGGTLTGATVSIGAGFLTGDKLNFTNQNGITGSYNAATGVLTLSGIATVAQYQAALDSITFGRQSEQRRPDRRRSGCRPDDRLDVTDGTASSAPVTSTLNVAHAAPAVTAGGSATFTGGGPAVTLDGSLTISDPDSGGNLTGATVSIGAGFLSGDTLGFTAPERDFG